MRCPPSWPVRLQAAAGGAASLSWLPERASAEDRAAGACYTVGVALPIPTLTDPRQQCPSSRLWASLRFSAPLPQGESR